MSSRILIEYPGAVVRRLVWNRRDIVICDDEGWWILDESTAQRRCVDIFDFPISWSSQPDAMPLLATLKSWSPVWGRWIANADQYELLYREAVFYVLHVISALKALDIRTAIFHTPLSHHVIDSLIEIACATADVRQLFLYCDAISFRVQPMLQSQSIGDRHSLAVRISDYDATEDIKKFQANRLAGRPPSPFNGAAYRSFGCGILDASYIAGRQTLRQLTQVSRRKSKTSRFLAQFEPLGAPHFMRLLAQQRRALAYMQSRQSTESIAALVARASGPVLLLAAHLQPEATSFPEGGEFNNHLDILVRIRNLGFDGPILYKEHYSTLDYWAPLIGPTRVGMNRSVAYYQRIEELGCTIVNPRESVPLDAETNARLMPVTITGSIALERALLGKRTIVAGHPWFKGIPGTVSLSSVRSVHDIVAPERDVANGIAEDAFQFVDDKLTGKTILNVPGIGSGRVLRDQRSVQKFAEELNRLLEHV